MNSRHAAAEFYRRLQGRDPDTRARWGEIMEDARQGDPRAVRAVLLVRTMLPSASGQVRVAGTGNVSFQRIEQLRQMLINARFSAPAFL